MTTPTPIANRQLVLYVLREPGFLEDALRVFRDALVRGIEVIESQSVASMTSEEVPIFASFRHIFTGAESYNYVIFGAVDAVTQVQLIAAELQVMLGDVEKRQRGELYAVPLSFALDLGTADLAALR